MVDINIDNGKDANEVNCAICLDTYYEASFSIFSCGHSFHLGCSRDWLVEHSTCPMCRRCVTKNNITTKVRLDLLNLWSLCNLCLCNLWNLWNLCNSLNPCNPWKIISPRCFFAVCFLIIEVGFICLSFMFYVTASSSGNFVATKVYENVFRDVPDNQDIITVDGYKVIPIFPFKQYGGSVDIPLPAKPQPQPKEDPWKFEPPTHPNECIKFVCSGYQCVEELVYNADCAWDSHCAIGFHCDLSSCSCMRYQAIK